MEWVKGWFSGPKKRERPIKETRTVSLKGRDTPIDLLEKGTFRMRNASKAEYSVNPDKSILTVNIPKQGKRKRKDYQMEFYEHLDDLMDATAYKAMLEA